MLQYAQVPRSDGRPDRQGRPDLRAAVVARRDHRPARSVVQSGYPPFPRRLRTARPQVHHRLRLHADPDDHLPRGRRHPAQGAAVDSQAHAADDPLHAARLAGRHPPAAAALLRLSREGGADPCQHGGQRPLLPRAGRREEPPLRRLSVALPPNEPARRRIRGRTRLVLRIRIPAGAGPRLRRVRRPADDGLFRTAPVEGTERDLLGVGRRDGLVGRDRRAVRPRAGTPHPQDRFPQPVAPLGPAVRHPAPRRPHGGDGRLSVAHGADRPRSLHVAAGHHARTGSQGGLHRRAGQRVPHAPRRRFRRFGIGRAGSRRPAVVLLHIAGTGIRDRQPRDLAPLRRSDEVDPRGLPPRHRRPCGAARQRTGLGVGRARGAHMDEFLCGRTARHPAQRVSGRDQRPVVQRRQLCAVTGRRGGRQGVRRRMEGRSGADQGVVSGKILASGGGIPGRFRKRRRDQPLHPPQHGRRLRPELHDARRGAAHLRAAHRPPIPAHPEGAAFALAAESALQRLLRRRRPDALPRRDERYGVGMAAALLRQGPLCAHRRRLHTRSRAIPRRLRRGHPVPRHRFDLEDVRRRPALRP